VNGAPGAGTTWGMKCLLPLLFAPVMVFAADPPPVFAPKVERLDAALDQVLAPGANLEKLAEGFVWSEGPVWKDGSLLFSDVPDNKIYQWTPGAKAPKIFLKPSGGMEATPQFTMPGSNGLTVDAKGNLILCQQGPRRVARLEADGRQVRSRIFTRANTSTARTMSFMRATGICILPIRLMGWMGSMTRPSRN